MPWNMNDYPSSLKNVSYSVRKKTIDIANALVDEGYDEGRAIPIATKQAESWYENRTEEEIKDFVSQADPTIRDKNEKEDGNRPEMLE